MLSHRYPAGRPTSRLTAVRTTWLAAFLFALPLTGFAVAQGYSQQPYQDPAYAQQPYSPDPAQQDPPSRVARLSFAQGTLSVQPANAQDFAPAEVNYPLTSGDRIWADAGSLAELQIGQAAVRLGQQTDFTVSNLTDTFAQFGLAQGSVHLRAFNMEPNTSTELDTPNAAITLLAPGDLRVDVYPQNNLTLVTLLSGSAQVNAEGISQMLRPGETLQISGANPANARDVRRPRPDGLDSFSAGQDNAYQSAMASQNAYVDEGMIGAQDLGGYGDWSPDADYGSVWFPRGVAVGWQPYRYGHWAYIGPWGWTWVASEPWGFAPFHYGRWGQFGGRWGWIPGPRVVRPVYSPALVAFVGGGGPGVGVTAWFPLGPREPFQPWYHTSDRYVTRVNVSNIYVRNQVDVRAIWEGRRPSPFRPDPNRQYVNRGIATVAMRQDAFASGRPVGGAAMRVDPREFGNRPILARPDVAPSRGIVNASGPARALPPRLQRPMLEGGGGNRPGGPGNPPQFGGQTGGRPGDFRGNQPGNQPGKGPGGQQAPGQETQQAPYRHGPVAPAPGQLQPNPSQPGQSGPQRGGQDSGNGQGGYRNGSMPAPNQPFRPQPGQPSGQQPSQGNPGQGNPGQRPFNGNPPAPGNQPGQPQPGQNPGGQNPGQRPGGPTPPTVVTQPGAPGNHVPVGPERGPLQTMPAQPAPQPQQPRNFEQPRPTPPPVNNPPQPQPRNFEQPRPTPQPVNNPPQPQPRNFEQPRPTPQPVNNPPQPQPRNFEQPRPTPQPVNNPPQPRPSPQPQPQFIPRPAPQAQPQPQPRVAPPQAEHKPQ